ncbi:hypothetical protein STEG23_014146, partial [Scotinomys teguina]
TFFLYNCSPHLDPRQLVQLYVYPVTPGVSQSLDDSPDGLDVVELERLVYCLNHWETLPNQPKRLMYSLIPEMLENMSLPGTRDGVTIRAKLPAFVMCVLEFGKMNEMLHDERDTRFPMKRKEEGKPGYIQKVRIRASPDAPGCQARQQKGAKIAASGIYFNLGKLNGPGSMFDMATGEEKAMDVIKIDKN